MSADEETRQRFPSTMYPLDHFDTAREILFAGITCLLTEQMRKH